MVFRGRNTSATRGPVPVRTERCGAAFGRVCAHERRVCARARARDPRDLACERRSGLARVPPLSRLLAWHRRRFSVGPEKRAPARNASR